MMIVMVMAIVMTPTTTTKMMVMVMVVMVMVMMVVMVMNQSPVSRTSLSTASLLCAQFRFKGVSLYCCRSVSKTPLCSNF